MQGADFGNAASYRGQARSRFSMTTEGAPSARGAMRPISKTVSPAASKAARTSAALPAATTTAMPTPQLKVRSISAGAMPPVAASQRNIAGTGQVMPGSTTPKLFGKRSNTCWQTPVRQ